ncbi:MAG: hypothetical protein RI925_1902 [Pseudomonadota bacterium]
MVKTCDFLVVGSGIAGASVAYELAKDAKVILLEQEAQPGYHATGRSAAIFLETYGSPTVRALTCASRSFYEHPDDGFTEVALMRARGAVFLGTENDLPELRAHFAEVSQLVKSATWLDATALYTLLPCLKPGLWVAGAWEPDAQDLDVNAIHQGFLRGFRRHDGELWVNAPLISAHRDMGVWHVKTAIGDIETPYLVNAAGAWCDKVAQAADVKPVGLTPLQRTAISIAAPANASINAWPYFGDIAESFYIKPDAGCLLASPCDQTPVDPCDAAPDEYDVAVIADRIEKMTVLPVERMLAKWAGLRTFSADRTPVAGWATDMEGFFWLAGQGGYGIQTAPALSRFSAGMILRGKVDAELSAFGITEAALSPARFQVAHAELVVE